MLLLVVAAAVPAIATATAAALLVVLLVPAAALPALLVVATAAAPLLETAAATALVAMRVEILRIASATTVVIAAGIPTWVPTVAAVVLSRLGRRVGRTVVPGRPIARRRAGLGCLRIAVTHTLRVVSSGRVWTQERRRTQESRGKFELGEAVPGETSHGLADLGPASSNG